MRVGHCRAWRIVGLSLERTPLTAELSKRAAKVSGLSQAEQGEHKRQHATDKNAGAVRQLAGRIEGKVRKFQEKGSRAQARSKKKVAGN